MDAISRNGKVRDLDCAELPPCPIVEKRLDGPGRGYMLASSGVRDCETTGALTQLDSLCSDLESRAQFMVRVAWTCLSMVVVLFIAAVWVLWKSGEVAGQDIERVQGIFAAETPDWRDVDFRDVAVNPENGNAIAVGRISFILTSTGIKPIRDDGDSRDTLRAAAFSGDGRTAVAVGRRGRVLVSAIGLGLVSASGRVLVSADSDVSWRSPDSATGNDFNDVALSDDGETIVAVGENGLLRTSVDGGRTLENPGAVTARDLKGVALSADGDIAVAVGDKETILIWTKQDKMWTSVSGSDDSRIDFEAVALRRDGNETTVVAVGEDGAIRRFYAKNASDKKPDNKRNWIDMDDNKRRAPDFDAVALSGDGKIAIAVGRRGAIRFSTDGGGTWKDAASKVGNHFRAVKIIGDGNRVIAVVAGDDGNIVISEDKGETWTFRDSRTASDLNAIASAGNAAVVVGENATIFRLSPPAFDVVRFPPREELAKRTQDTGITNESRNLTEGSRKVGA